MVGVTKLVTEKTVELAMGYLKQLGKQAQASRKLDAVIATKKYGISKVAEFYDISRSTLTLWIKSVNEQKLDELTVASGRGRKSKFTYKQMQIIEQWFMANPSITLKELSHKVSSKFGIQAGLTTLYRTLQKIPLSYITPRPVHHKQDKSLHTEFKKKSTS